MIEGVGVAAWRQHGAAKGHHLGFGELFHGRVLWWKKKPQREGRGLVECVESGYF
jgi:hypothetical protein